MVSKSCREYFFSNLQCLLPDRTNQALGTPPPHPAPGEGFLPSIGTSASQAGRGGREGRTSLQVLTLTLS